MRKKFGVKRSEFGEKKKQEKQIDGEIKG